MLNWNNQIVLVILQH